MSLTPKDFELVRNLVFKQAGIVLDTGKDYLIESRLAGLARKAQVASIAQLMQKLTARHSATERDVVDAMTTNETSFFRDTHPFDALRKSILPDLGSQHANDRTLNIWCAASSTGQEPYTIAMMLRETIPGIDKWKLTFIASDLSRDVLDRARSGKYSQLEINRGLPAPLLVKYFRKTGIEWEVIPELRKMIDFREINLLEQWPVMPALDLVFIRNVLIYFNQETKKQILGRIRRLMRPSAYLFLGGAETTLNLDDNFERMQFDKSGCYRLMQRSAVAA